MSDQIGRWRVVDIVTAAVLGAAVGVTFVAWNQVGGFLYNGMDALTPGLGGLAAGIWFMGGPIGGLLIRKPGAAILVEVLAATVSMAIGSQWGVTTIISGLLQGLAAELVFLAFRYKKFTPAVAGLSGGAAGLAAVLFEGVAYGHFAKGLTYNLIYASASVISGVILAGLLSWVLVRALAKTGVLNRFSSGRQYAPRV